jgi:Ca2+/Na+ antiporter
MKLLSVLVLSAFILVGLFLGIYCLLYKQKVKEAQRETNIITPAKLFQFLNGVIIVSFLSSVVSLIFLLFELLIQ